MTFPIINVSSDASTQLEQLGTKAKFWYWSGDGRRMLFKEGRPGTGENWSEKVCCEIARQLGLPHAEYDLALWRDRKGVASPSLVPEGDRLILGNELLVRFFDKYETTVRYRASQHTLRRAAAALQHPSIEVPIGWHRPPEMTSAVSVFVGYLLLDALVGNQDRHHENWGLIISTEGGLSLAPTFDHASSLGRNETDENRNERLTTKDKGHSMEAYVERARSGLYETHTSKRSMTTLGAFMEGAKIDSIAGRYWLERLVALQPHEFREILDQIPDDWISPTARNFAFAMLKINRHRLIAESELFP